VTTTRATPAQPGRLLEELAASTTAPVVTVHLSSGRDLRGRVVAVASTGDGAVVVLRTSAGGGDGRFADDETHVRVGCIDAVTVHDASSWRAAPPGDAAIGKLEVRRLLGDAGARLGAAGGPASFGPPDAVAALVDADRAAVAAAAPAVEAALLGVLADELGRAALATVRAVVLRAGAATAVRRADGALEIVVPLDPAQRPTRWAEAIEAAL
jgi:hypothetical protein